MLKGTAKAPAVVLLRLNTLRGTKKRCFQPLKGTTSTPVLYIWVCPENTSEDSKTAEGELSGKLLKLRSISSS